MRDFEELKYFLEPHFGLKIRWELIEYAVIEHRQLSKKERVKFKKELLYMKELLEQKQYEKIQQIIKKNNLENTKLYNIDKIQKFIDKVLPIIEKYEYKKGIPYVPFKALNYLFDTIITPKTKLSFNFIAIDIKREGDTFIHHILQDLKYVEKAFIEKDEANIQKVLQLSRDKGITIFESQDRDKFIEVVTNELSY
ncbi:hypothetical protein ABE61_21255 [Lysinibacillus sphaericus]|uniref:hypothetical protein n=1 Tax=Lysinibacillus sphaericus TaxID=1421 RepID=UPI0018CCBD0D|nr:hypothetical protein [Lysinibacillus sphaericus]MBG9456469.1 hypothetical protein [Lysinibacillus sphaericus]MBG9476543.1 hypothetical protein [Lysinibacillus sphaericus]MBG9594593.1 hypothetical protein [Lysinibacillus sphaericus]